MCEEVEEEECMSADKILSRVINVSEWKQKSRTINLLSEKHINFMLKSFIVPS